MWTKDKISMNGVGQHRTRHQGPGTPGSQYPFSFNFCLERLVRWVCSKEWRSYGVIFDISYFYCLRLDVILCVIDYFLKLGNACEGFSWLQENRRSIFVQQTFPASHDNYGSDDVYISCEISITVFFLHLFLLNISCFVKFQDRWITLDLMKGLRTCYLRFWF